MTNRNIFRFIEKRELMDKGFIERFSECFEKVYGLHFNYRYNKKRNSLIFNANCEILCKDLLNYCKYGTFEWQVPKQILESNNKKIMCNFLKGIYDSEGSVGKRCISMVSMNKKE